MRSALRGSHMIEPNKNKPVKPEDKGKLGFHILTELVIVSDF